MSLNSCSSFILFLCSLFLLPSSIICWRDSSNLQSAINAAIVRVLSLGEFYDAELATGFRSLAVLSCTPDPTHFPFPVYASQQAMNAAANSDTLAQVLTTGTVNLAGIKYAALPDGDFTVTPPIGFWPQYTSKIIAQVSAFYNISIHINYVFYPTSNAALDALLLDQVDMSDFYFVIAGFDEHNLPRRYSYVPSCSVLGYASSFFTLASSNITSAAQLHDLLHSSSSSGVPNVIATLSQGDFQNVRPLLLNTTTNIVVTNVSSMIALLQSGSIAAAALSGLPPDPLHLLSVFPTTVIDPRGCMFAPPPQQQLPTGNVLCKDVAGNTPMNVPHRPNLKSLSSSSSSSSLSLSASSSTFTAYSSPSNFSSLALAMNAALIRLVSSGILTEIAAANYPFRASQCWTCSPSPISDYSFPESLSTATGALKEVLTGGVLKIAGAAQLLTSPSEGVYTSAQPTGYYPSVMRALVSQLSIAYGVSITPVWTLYSNISTAFNSVSLDQNHMTDIYFSVSTEFLGHLSVRSFFTPMCSNIGDTYFLIVSARLNISTPTDVASLIARGVLPSSFGILSSFNIENVNAVIPTKYLTRTVVSSNFGDLVNAVRNYSLAGAVWSIAEVLPPSLNINLGAVSSATGDVIVLRNLVVSPKVAFFRPPLFSACPAPTPQGNSTTTMPITTTPPITTMTTAPPKTAAVTTPKPINAAVREKGAVPLLLLMMVIAMLMIDARTI